MAEQFPTLGNWVAGLVKKQVTDAAAAAAAVAAATGQMKKEAVADNAAYNESLRARSEVSVGFGQLARVWM